MEFLCSVKSRDNSGLLPGTGNQLTPEIKAAISKCRKGDLILFYDIEGRGANGIINNKSNNLIYMIK